MKLAPCFVAAALGMVSFLPGICYATPGPVAYATVGLGSFANAGSLAQEKYMTWDEGRNVSAVIRQVAMF